MLELKGLNIYYGESHIVRDVNIIVPKGAVVSLMGRNGVGKTTIMKAVMGLLPARRGQVVLNGKIVTKDPPFIRARMGIGYVPQGREIIPNLTVEENIRIGLSAARDGRRSIPPEVFLLFPVLKEMQDRRGGDLSGGQQQMLAIARALAAGPELLLLDEPTEGIQPSIIKEIIGVIKQLKTQAGTTILLVEQYLSFVRGVSDFFYIMEKGSIAAEGPIGQLTDDVIHKHLMV